MVPLRWLTMKMWAVGGLVAVLAEFAPADLSSLERAQGGHGMIAELGPAPADPIF
jgi:hypothetical protein